MQTELLGSPLRTWEFHPLKARTCPSHTLRNPDSQFVSDPAVNLQQSDLAKKRPDTSGL